ncbi:MAG: energy-coupling factor transporter transmembrane protein EcfT [Coriobacteriia bacterium]|nr:energy-coupling factor transporter transmembrane protein EcfT [Coriobacteriia bacterium]MDR2714143.1 energy-coupling factor transporter transmembrane protein EcfT [Coriobacteriales bacterium]
MAVVVPFGQYIPGNSLVHTLDVRMKLLLVVAYVFALFSCGWFGLLVCAAALIVAYLVAGIPLARAVRGLFPVLFILAFTFLFNAFTFTATPAQSVAFDTVSLFGTALEVPQSISLIGGFGIVPLGVVRGLYFALRITLLVSVTTLLTFTSSIVALTDAISSLLSPLRFVGVPVEDVAMMFTIALRFIPLTTAEVEKIMVAQSSRGVRFDQGGLIKRARAYVPVMVPLFVNLFKRADELAAAMESRCYEGAGRTRLKVSRLAARDWVVGLAGTAFFVALGVLSLLGVL